MECLIDSKFILIGFGMGRLWVVHAQQCHGVPVATMCRFFGSFIMYMCTVYVCVSCICVVHCLGFAVVYFHLFLHDCEGSLA